MEASYRYSVLQLTPDEVRGERVNVGIVVYRDEGIDVRTDRSPDKLRALDERIGADPLNEVAETLIQWALGLRTSEEQYQALVGLGGITVSTPGWFSTEDQDYERAVAQLMRRLVYPPAAPKEKPGHRRLTTEISNALSRHQLLGKTQEDFENHLIVPHFPVERDERLFADFAARNGSYWIVGATDFRSAGKVGMEGVREASYKVIVQMKAQEKFGEDTKGIVVYKATTEFERDIRGHLTLLGERAHKIWNLESKQDYSAFIDQMYAIAGDNRSIQEM